MKALRADSISKLKEVFPELTQEVSYLFHKNVLPPFPNIRCFSLLLEDMYLATF
jgi:hypothetical protein